MVNAGTRTHPPAVRWVALARWAAGVIFLVFGVTKFSGHAAELASFRHYPLPAPEVFVYLVGVVEIGGGLLLIMGLRTRLAALALAADMLGAIVVSGLARGELISLTLAPLLLVAMLSLIRLGAGPWSLDRWIARKAASGTASTRDIPNRLQPRSHPRKEN
jgi:putative oxidoreductase